MGMDIVPELMITFKAEENGNVANDNDARGASRYISGIFSRYQELMLKSDYKAGRVSVPKQRRIMGILLQRKNQVSFSNHFNQLGSHIMYCM